MKRIIMTSVIILILFGMRANAEDSAKVIAYYFHATARCATCQKIEKLTEECLNDSFAEALKKGKLVFKPLNVDLKGNEHFVSDYNLYTKSVVLSLVENGREIKSKNLEKIWTYVRNEKKFDKYIREETQSFLEKVKGDESK